ncbi:MAG: PAS domain S-box protein [Marinicaulis sp.]|nr:PAS domain S-box protein [Marinicaulis sp.]
MHENKVRTIAVWDNGPGENFEYDLEFTPCANVINDSTCGYREGITELFPRDNLLVDMGAESYVGAPLRSTSGEVLGLLAVLDDSPMKRVEAIIEIVEIFAARAGAELERSAAASVNERLGKIVEDSVSEVYVFDPDTFNFLLVNRGARTNLGYTMEELRQLTPWDLKPEFSREQFIEMVEPLRNANPPHYSFETVHMRKDGTLYNVAVQLQYIGGSESVFYASITDVTERQKKDDQLKLLVNELNHRVKNTLAIVQSLSHQTFSGDGPRESQLQTFRDRLSALAAAHNLLTQGAWEQTSLAAVAEKTIGATCSLVDRVRMSGPPIQLSPKTAVTLAMALHELSTNAVKYGALSTDGGQVDMQWSLMRDSTNAIEIVWRESGGPRISGPPSRKGFGMRMIELSLGQEFDCDVVMSFKPEGLECTINGTLPAHGRPQ